MPQTPTQNPAPNVSQNTKPIQLNPMAQSHEPMKPVRYERLDTTTPMAPEGTVSRFLPADVHKYGPWLIPKLTQRWPQISAMTFSGWVMGWTNGNTFLFVKLPNAVGLAETFRQTPDLTLRVREVFAFCEGVEYEDQLVGIYKEFKRWARSLGATKIRDVGQASDLSNVRLRNNVGAKTDNGLMLEV